MPVSFPVILTKNNLIPNTTNQYKYDFSTNIDMSNTDIGLASASLFHSWRNISASKQNNQFQIYHPNSSTNTILSITIPDGGYEISDLNNYLRYYLVQNGYYIQNNSTLEQIIYCEFQVNPTTYKIDFVSYAMPTALPAGYTAGSAITFPATTRTPQLVVTHPNFGTLIGFELGTYPAVQPIVNTTSSSTKVPVVSDVQSVLISVDSSNNRFSPNSKVIYAISPANVPYAGLINEKPSAISWVPQQQGNRQSITLTLTNQSMVPLEIVDTDITIMLLLRIRDP
jgi:hypothetical protein